MKPPPSKANTQRVGPITCTDQRLPTRPRSALSLDVDRKLSVNDSMFLIAELNTTVVGTVMAGYDGHRGWINYLAVDPRQQGKSVGRLLMDRAELHLRERGCPKINLQIRSDNRSAADFYERLGYSTDDVISMGKRLHNDDVTDR